METYEVNRAAVGGCAKAVRAALKKLGMQRCSLQLVYRQCEASSLRLDYYKLFLRWLEALWAANRPGAEFLLEDLRARAAAFRERPPARADWYETLAACEREHSEAIQAAILNRDPATIRRELIEDIAAKRRLLAALEARARLAA